MDSASTLVGATVGGKYRVERVLGQGGMGIVVAARHLRLGQLVAIKFPLSTARRRDDAVERLLREARAAMRIRSEHVAKVHDVGLHDGAGPYLVMEYLVGRDLGTVLARSGPVPLGSAVEYVLQASEALAEAHAKGIVHRDVKPSNLFLSRRADGAPLIKVIDFGLAKTLRSEDQVTLTKSGAMLGSPLFMAPEQMRGSAEVDARADIWSLGATLYALLLGQAPFPGKNLLDVHDRIKLGPPQLAAVRAEIGPAVEQAILGCLKVDLSERHRTVADFAEALAEAVPNHAAAYAVRVRRTLDSSSATEEVNVEGEHSGSQQAAFAGDPGGAQATTARPLSASWLDESGRAQRERVETDVSLSLSAGTGPARDRRGRRLLAAVVTIGIVGAIVAAIGLVRGTGTTEKMGLQTNNGAIVGRHAAQGALAPNKAPSGSAPQVDPPREPPSFGPALAPTGSSQVATSASARHHRVEAPLAARAVEAVRDPLADPD
jgi:serine/threonine protein kinase